MEWIGGGVEEPSVFGLLLARHLVVSAVKSATEKALGVMTCPDQDSLLRGRLAPNGYDFL